MPQAGPVRPTLYNTAGQVVRRLVDQAQVAGQYQVTWDSRDDQGREVGSGVYLYRLQAGPFQQTRRLVLVK
jgi:flagellar hook assembly protein FlgD